MNIRSCIMHSRLVWWPMRYKVGDFRSFAEEDLAQLKLNRQFGFELGKSSCVHAQQYAEKMIKEKTVELGEDPRFDHNLVTLLNVLSEIGMEISEDLYLKSSVLTSYYIAARYPGSTEVEFNPETAEEAYSYALEIGEYMESHSLETYDGGRIHAVKKS